MTAVLGLGTHRVRAVDQAARTALAGGAVWVDTAPNYAGGRAHGLLAPVLADHPGVHVATKTGFVIPAQRQAAVREGVLSSRQAAAGHSLDPGFVRWQTHKSLADLGRADVVFVHNPERAGRGRAAIHARIRDAFAVLEEVADAGRIDGYGVATWSGFDAGMFTVGELVGLARQAAGGADHHLIALQQPVSLVRDTPIRHALAGLGSLVEADAAGLTTFGSAPLHGGELPALVTPDLADLIHPGLSPAAACLLAAASTPRLDVVLLSASTPAHWAQAQAALDLPLEGHRLRKITDVLAS
ncbi:aldo/keto reductase [Streptomyces sp. NPDC037389]|uniref:aldo/keto reductase n=1 Tax=Streptomyces sp. NPDC037389 TaxID=3155369 RepID=UPI0033D0E712